MTPRSRASVSWEKEMCYDRGMNQRRRLIAFLALNIFVSACVTLSILYAYDQYYRPANSPAPTAALASSSGGSGQMEITTVIGAGFLDQEVILLRNVGDSEIDLTGWTIQDQDGNVYTFPNLILHQSGAAQLHSAPGTDTIIDIYWNLTEAVWKSGELATLLDSSGSVRAVYQIP
jgi:hypothetical protein